MTIQKIHELFLQFPIACTDTRKIEEGCIFFSLKGEHFNGNSFASKALDQGAKYAIIDEKEFVKDERTILVDDALKTLQQLATYHRNYCTAKVISLTGSNGKTTTKELIYSVLSKKYRSIATKGNLNNHIGVPLTLLSINRDTEIAVVEMGANHQKEIEFLCTLAQPDYGYITNFGKAHLEGFGGEEGVIKGKSELYEFLISNKKHVFMNADDAIQFEKLETYIKKIGFSTKNKQYYTIEFIEALPFVRLKAEETEIQTQLVGSYNFSNCCAAILMGKYFNVPMVDIKNALENYIPRNNRSQILKRNGYDVILDAYNANPTSMEAALANFKHMDSQYKIVILGDMFELGETASKEHQSIADLVSNIGFDEVYLVGENFYGTKSDAHKFRSYENLADYLKNNPLRKGSILIKGSRGMALERTLEML